MSVFVESIKRFHKKRGTEIELIRIPPHTCTLACVCQRGLWLVEYDYALLSAVTRGDGDDRDRDFDHGYIPVLLLVP